MSGPDSVHMREVLLYMFRLTFSLSQINYKTAKPIPEVTSICKALDILFFFAVVVVRAQIVLIITPNASSNYLER